MVDNAKACGLVFDEGALATCSRPKPFHPLGPAHDEWKLIPWGLPEHRTVPANAVMSNTVKLRIAGMRHSTDQQILLGSLPIATNNSR